MAEQVTEQFKYGQEVFYVDCDGRKFPARVVGPAKIVRPLTALLFCFLLAFMTGSNAQAANASTALSVQYTPASTGADQTEDVLQTYSLPGNTLSGNGKALKIIAFGTTSASFDAKKVKLYFGAKAITAGPAITAYGGAWTLNLFVIKTGVGTQTILATGSWNGQPIQPQVLSGTEDETGSITIQTTGQIVANGTAPGASGITCSAMTVESFN